MKQGLYHQIRGYMLKTWNDSPDKNLQQYRSCLLEQEAIELFYQGVIFIQGKRYLDEKSTQIPNITIIVKIPLVP